MSSLTLVIGNKAISSWSLRPWLALKQTGQAFDEIVITLRQPDTAARILEHSPSGKVPALMHGDRTVWDSLAICEYLAETFPDARLWPDDAHARAVARAVSAEMHSGFAALRGSMSMNLKHRFLGEGRTPATEADIARIARIWTDARARFGQEGPFLFGRFSIADCMYAPVVTRFDTYGVALDPVCADYCRAVRELPAMREWTEAALAEPWDITEPPRKG
ncbi:glutathione S-transferase family protein [Azospirillum sp. SYSU D00513]|uniref:glutathione S-transferase family protein n=1 Tax=Azospirillum sp. SYSU D00513 TaxID=2812561 RepID=UPI001A95AFD1|nr:glutathione S-transferase family protein [Azospirillum sp. SYSU D00513]